MLSTQVVDKRKISVMKRSAIPCSKENFHLVAKISWLTCHKYLGYFTHYNKCYNEHFLIRCEEEIELSQQQLDYAALSKLGIEQPKEKERYESLIYVRLKRLYADAQVIFKHDKKVAEQFDFMEILKIVTLI